MRIQAAISITALIYPILVSLATLLAECQLARPLPILGTRPSPPFAAPVRFPVFILQYCSSVVGMTILLNAKVSKMFLIRSKIILPFSLTRRMRTTEAGCTRDQMVSLLARLQHGSDSSDERH